MNDPMLVTLTKGQLEELVRNVVRSEVAIPRQAEILTLEDVAQLLRVTDRTVRSYIEDEGLPASRLPNGWRFFRKEVIAWMQERKPRKTTEEG